MHSSETSLNVKTYFVFLIPEIKESAFFTLFVNVMSEFVMPANLSGLIIAADALTSIKMMTASGVCLIHPFYFRIAD